MAPGAPAVHRDPADEAMVARAHERFAAERRRPRGRTANRRAAQPDRDRWPQVRDHQPAPLPQPPPRDHDVAPEGAELLRRGAELGAGRRLVRRALRPRRRGPRRDLAPLHGPPAPRGGGRADAGADPRTPTSSTWSATRSTGCSPTTCTTSPAATRGASCRGGVRPLGHRLRGSQPLRVPARAIPRRVRPERVRIVSREELEGRARATSCAGCSSSSASTRTSPPRSSTASGRPAARKAGGRLPAHGPGGAPPGAARAGPQLRPPARADALAGRADRPRPRLRRGREAGAPRRAAPLELAAHLPPGHSAELEGLIGRPQFRLGTSTERSLHQRCARGLRW